MLIEISISNFRSFRERQTFSMVAAPRLRKLNNVFRAPVEGETLPSLLKVAAIYGPNASGKSNLIKALHLVPTICRRTPSAAAVSLPATSFRFDAELAQEPSSIEIHFIAKGMRYRFDLALTSERVVEEKLSSFPKGKEVPLYARRHTPDGDQYETPNLEGGPELIDAWKKLTSRQTLFISQAVANSNEELNQLRTPLSWLQDGMMVVQDDMKGWADASQRLAKEHPRFTTEISKFLQEVDVPVTDISFVPVEDTDKRELISYSISEGNAVSSPVEKSSISSASKSKTSLTHRTALGEAKFDFKDESAGTRNLIGFWLPWSIATSEIKPLYPSTLVVDEFDSSLHPKIVETLVEKHLDSSMASQLIFTTHDTHLMDTRLLRRDQIWLTERDANGATQLRSIHEFEGRESEDVEKRYYEGRYRGLPIVRKG